MQTYKRKSTWDLTQQVELTKALSMSHSVKTTLIKMSSSSMDLQESSLVWSWEIENSLLLKRLILSISKI